VLFRSAVSDPARIIAGMERSTARVGREGEDAALAWYRHRGYTLLERNWRCALGELDLVLSRGTELVICEVKSRRSDAYGGPFEAVTSRKQRKLGQLAEAFLAASDVRPESVRFDVASVAAWRGTRSPAVHVFEQAF